ncbi:20876_t:CDS:2, partial [Gigaspora margarita]
FEENSNDPDSVEDDISTTMDAVAIGQKDNSRKAYYKKFRENELYGSLQN